MSHGHAHQGRVVTDEGARRGATPPSGKLVRITEVGASLLRGFSRASEVGCHEDDFQKRGHRIHVSMVSIALHHAAANAR